MTTVRDARCACGALKAQVEGNPIRLSICHCLECRRTGSACGVTIWYEIERRPGMVSIPAGAFADAAFPPPAIEVYAGRRCPWLPDTGIPREF
jgi:hypothetical protein